MSPTLMAMLHGTFLRRYICFDKANKAHKFVAHTLVFWTLQHVITHYYKFHQLEVTSNGKISMFNLLYKKTTGKIGHIMLSMLGMLLIGTLPVVRRKCFELFYLLHHLSMVIVILIFLHVQTHTFHYYITGPGIIYLTDRVFRAVRARFNRPRILSVIQHPSNVVEIRFERNGMKYKAGQFIYLCVPSLSWYQWHPFTLSSAPEEGELSVHIRISGGWTRSLVHTLQQHAATAPRRINIEHQPRRRPSKKTDSIDSNRTLTPSYDIRNHNNSRTQGPMHPPGARVAGGGRGANEGNRQMDLHRQASERSANNVRMGSLNRNGRYPPEMDYYMTVDRPYTRAQMRANKALPAAPAQTALPTIMVDGPYNAPTQDVFEYDHIVLIAGNIGITPMSSVLKSLYYQLTTSGGKARFKKVYFIWSCRDVQSLEWFQGLLAALDMEDVGDVLEIRTYLTGQLHVDQIRNIALYQDPHGPDAVTGLYRSPTYFGRPDFDMIFGEIGQRSSSTDIGVFVCGSQGMSRMLNKITNKWNKELRQRHTRFIFHEERSTE
ncbi:hypothetical protein H4R24_003029 [Coemansia sp. RSA 988]|nr:hypothetical protein H4R24_003029 [Coemansia sp. RSA 988]